MNVKALLPRPPVMCWTALTITKPDRPRVCCSRRCAAVAWSHAETCAAAVRRDHQVRVAATVLAPPAFHLAPPRCLPRKFRRHFLILKNPLVLRAAALALAACCRPQTVVPPQTLRPGAAGFVAAAGPAAAVVQLVPVAAVAPAASPVLKI